MKKFSFILIAIAAMFVSCSKELDTVSINEEVEYIEVPVKALLNNVELTGEESLTKSGNDSEDIWGIAIYSNTQGCFYGHGFYDDISLLTSFKLVKGDKYTISSCYVTDIKSKLGENIIGTTSKYAEPFCFLEPQSDTYKAELNSMHYNSRAYVPSTFLEPTAHLDSKYYYFHTENYTADENTPITLDYILCDAGFKFIFKKVEGYNYDYVNVDFGKGSCFTKKIQLTNGEGEYLISNMGIYDPWYEEFSHSVNFGTNENEKFFWGGTIKQKRGTIRTYIVYLQPQGSNINIGINYSSENQVNEDMGNLN